MAGGLRQSGRAVDASPLLAAAEDAEHATLYVQRVGSLQADIAAVGAAILRIVNFSGPSALLPGGPHAEQDRHAERGARA